MQALAGFNLTGVWDGRFAYPSKPGPRELPPTPFQAVILELGEGFTGSIWEIADAGPEKGLRLNAALEGRRDGRRVAFVKRYDGTGGRTHAVAYRGELNADGTAIEGRWTIPGVWTGRFTMTRPPKQETAVEREAVARAG